MTDPRIDQSINQPTDRLPIRPTQYTEEGTDLVKLSLEPHRDTLLDAPPSQFFSGFRLRELDEGDAADMNPKEVLDIGWVG